MVMISVLAYTLVGPCKNMSCMFSAFVLRQRSLNRSYGWKQSTLFFFFFLSICESEASSEFLPVGASARCVVSALQRNCVRCQGEVDL